jgi:hypothetical protein
LFGEEPEKQRPAVPQDDGKTPNACPTQRRTQTGVRWIRTLPGFLLKEAIPLTNGHILVPHVLRILLILA